MLKKRKKEVNEVIRKKKIMEFSQKKSNQKQAHFNAISKKLKAFYSLKSKNKKQQANLIMNILRFGKSLLPTQSSKKNQMKFLLTNSQTMSNSHQTNPYFSQNKQNNRKKKTVKNEYLQGKKILNQLQKIRKKGKKQKKVVIKKKKKIKIC